ncbi:hypothetical protein FRC02_007912 [Tulasnella sp. 418]|nr:hypothetical protein FRC02_007912 [Tulasnella sp. 418]
MPVGSPIHISLPLSLSLSLWDQVDEVLRALPLTLEATPTQNSSLSNGSASHGDSQHPRTLVAIQASLAARFGTGTKMATFQRWITKTPPLERLSSSVVPGNQNPDPAGSAGETSTK